MPGLTAETAEDDENQPKFVINRSFANTRELLDAGELPLTAMLKPDRVALLELITMRDSDIQRRGQERSDRGMSWQPIRR